MSTEKDTINYHHCLQSLRDITYGDVIIYTENVYMTLGTGNKDYTYCGQRENTCVVINIGTIQPGKPTRIQLRVIYSTGIRPIPCNTQITRQAKTIFGHDCRLVKAV
jgi:hypothetical protein